MSVLKLSKNDITKNDDQEKKIKLKRSDLSFDSAMVSTWEQTNRQSLDILNDYNNRINKSEWLSKEDRAAYRSALDSYIETSNRLRGINKTFGEGYSEEDEKSWLDSVTSMNTGYDEISRYYGQFGSDVEYKKWYEDSKKSEEFKATLGAADIEEYSTLGANTSNPTWNETRAPLDILGWKPFGDGKTINNMVTFSEANAQKAMEGYAQAMRGGGGVDELTELVTLIDQYMEDDEKRIYNYYVGKGEADKAAEYLTFLTDDLKRRQAGSIVTNIGDSKLQAMSLAIAAGLDQFGSGIRNLDNYFTGAEEDGTSATQYASSTVRENLDGFWGGAYDVLNTTSNMLPSILVSTIPVVGKGLGLAAMGGSAVGNSYAEMRKRGYEDWQAAGYATLVGASEVALQSLLGGISKLGGKFSVSTAVTKLVDKFDHALAKFAIKMPLNMASEGLEEAIQTVLEPAFEALMTGEEFDAPEWEDVLYSGLLGALSAGLIEGVPSAIGLKKSKSDAKAYKDTYGVDSQALVTEALEIDPQNAHAQAMQSKLNKGKALSGYNIEHLVNANENALVEQDKGKIKAKAAEMLTKYGETGDISKIADVIAKVRSGEKITKAERAILSESKVGRRVSTELNPDIIEEGTHASEWTADIGTERINAEAYNRAVETYATQTDTRTENPLSDVAAPDTVTNADTTEEELAAETEIKAPVAMEAEAVNVAEEATEAITADEDTVAEEEATVTLEEAAAKYGDQAQAMIHTYTDGQDVAQYDKGYQVAYDMGKSGVSLSYVMSSDAASYLTEQQRELAYEAGKAAADSTAKAQDAKNKKAATGKTGRKKGTVTGQGVKIDDLKKTFNDTQNKAYKILSTYAEATGIDIVLYKSETDADGNFIGAQGKFKWSDDKIYIDINAGLKNIKDVNELAKYAMLRSFSHEFTHFLEKYSPISYNEFRKVVFDVLTERGENVNDLIEEKQAANPGMTYEQASREVVAEAMTDILPDSRFVEMLANKHKNIFEKLLDMLKDFLADIKEYFSALGHNRSREANALKEEIGDTVHYVESIVELFDKVAVEAVENYQMTVAFEEKAEKIDSTVTKKAENIASKAEKPAKAETESATEQSKPETAKEAPEGVGEWADVYERLKNPLRSAKRFYHDGYLFRVYKNGEQWQGLIDKANQSNGYEVNDPNGFHYKSEMFSERADAVEDIIAVARENKLFEAKADETKTKTETKTHVSETKSETESSTESETETKPVTKEEQSIEEREAAYKKKFSKWLKKAGRQAVLHYGGEAFLSDGAFGMIATEDEIGWAKLEFSGTITDTDLPKAAADALDNATTLLTEAPIEGVIGMNTVYAFDVDGKQVVYSKKLLSMLDGNLFYVGDFLKGAKILKAVDAEGNVVGFLLPMRTAPDAKIANTKPSKLKSFSKKMQPRDDAATKKEVKADVENADNRGTVQQPDTDRQGDPQVLEGLQTSDVSGDAQRGDTVGDAAERGQEVGRDGAATDNGAGTRSGSGDGDRQSGDLRRDDELTSHEAAKSYAEGKGYRIEINKLSAKKNIIQVDIYDKQGLPTFNPVIIGELGKDSDVTKWNQVKEAIDKREAADNSAADTNNSGKLHEEVTTQIEQQSTELPKGKNFVIGDTLDLPKGEKARYKANIEAIRLVKQLEAEGRYATEAEQVILSKYVGWGGLANAFDERKSDWSKEYKELQELLTKEEYELARGSTLNAHYTEISVIKAMYDGLAQLGFNGGRMMEPSSGVGNFVGAMPAEMSAKVKSWTMVELDSITGLIAKYLYPNADVRIQGFEKANIPNNYMDVIISNVPFGNYPITDKAYPKKVTSAIHNYFFAKSLDKVRPGGIVMFITSAYTMNSKDSTVRRYIMQRADLLGAIRLPDTAFKGNAGTEVVTDILILKKRAANTPYEGEDFLEAPYKYVNGYNGAYINSYFEAHPEMVLGTASMEGSMYSSNSLTYKALEGKGSLADQIRAAFKNIKGKMDYPAQLSPEKTNFAVERADKKTKEDGYVSKDGKIYQNKGGELVEQSVAPKVAERIKGMLEIRDAAKALMTAQQQGLNETEIKKAREKLNKLYDAFVKKNGYLNSPSNRSAFSSDPDRYSLFALENWNPEKKTATKADIFSKNTIAPNRTVTSAKDVSEGLIVSVNQTGGVDIPLIAKLTGKSEADVTRELLDSRQAFKNRDGIIETAETYLSGNVRAKLRDAEALVPMDSDYAKNVEALKAVIPDDVSYQDIFVNPGTPWIPSSVYSDFAAYMLGTTNTEWRQNIDITRNPDTGNFTVELKNAYLKHNAQNTQKWGTPRRTFLELLDAMLNSKSVVIKNKLDDGSTVIDRDATAAANEKIENITKEFQDWLWRDEARRTELATLYNEVFNSIVTPKYNGDNLTVNGANAMKPLRPHQRNAVQRIISSGGNTLLAHKVGAGKTYEMAAAAMKLKELGLVRKPMFAVPKSLVAQWGTEFIDFFPTAKLLVAEASDFTAANRKVFMNRIANGNYDAVIVSYEQFEKLPVSDDFTRELYQEQINSVIAAIEVAKAEKGGKALSVKDLEKKRKSLQAKIDKLTDKAKDEGNIDFEALGVDALFIDEAHNFKNLFYTTSMTNVSGLGSKDGSKRAFDLYTKVRYLQKLNGGKGIVFATATPVMNSMSEMYIMQKYLQPDLLEQLGLSTFDAWAKQFGEVVNGVEIKPSGQGYRVKQSFSRFKNMSELQLLFRNFADVLTDIPGLKIPKMKGGAVQVVVCEPGEFQQDFMKELEKRADNIKNVDPSVDNMLKITSDGRKISYTQRMIDPTLPYEEGCKIYRAADNIVRVYNDSNGIKGTQVVFLDMATPKGKSNTEATEDGDDTAMDMESARLYDDLKVRLVSNGIPAKEIAFIHEADTDQKKKKLFADVNDGKVRVLIGSTGKMGVGMNAQKRIVAIHHLDAPWRPGDVEQRNGRAFRQGNINDEVENFTYVTEGSFDARLWDILERKQNFINQIMNGESVGREAEDTGEVTLSAAEVKALASGSPLIMEQVQLDTDIKKLESLYRAHLSAVRAARERLVKDKGTIDLLERKIDLGKSDMLATKDTYSDGKFSITVGKQKFTDKKDAGASLMAEATARANFDGYATIGSFAGFDVKVMRTSEGIKGLILGKQGYSFNTYPNNTTFMINHMISVVEGISERVNAWNTQLEETKKDMAEQEKLINEPFAKQAELDEKRKRYTEVMEILNPKEEQAVDSVDDDTVQEQSREYLEDDYSTYGVHWGVDEGIMSEADARAVWKAIADIRKRGYKSYLTTVNGEHFVESTNLLMVVNTDYRYPFIRKIYVFYDSYETNLAQARRRLIDAKGNPTGNREALRIIEALFGEGYVEQYDFEYGRTNEWQDGRGKGTNGGTTSEGDVQYQQRTDTLTDREVLEMASNEIKVSDLNQAERDALTIFQDRLSKLKDLQEERAEQGRLYKEQQFGAKPDRAEAAKTLSRMHVLDGQITKATADILSVEEKEVLKRVLKKARKVVEVQERMHGMELLNRWRERRNNAAAIKKYRDRLRGDVDELSTWILSPDNKSMVKHVPDVLKNAVIPFLSSINFMSKRALKGGDATVSDKEFLKRLNALRSAIKTNIDVYGLYSGYNDLPSDFMDNLQHFIETAQILVDKSAGEFIINQMTSGELKELSQVVRTLKKYIMQFNRFHNNAMYQHVYEAGDDSIDFLKELDNAGEKTGAVSNFLFWQQIRPAYAFERFGEGGKAIYDGLRQGQAKLAFNTKEIERFATSAYTAKEVKAWEDEIKEFGLGRDLVKIPVSHIMSFYELSKDPEALVHINEGGIRVATYTRKGKKISDIGHILTVGEFNQIIGSLTDRQREVADSLQKYMATQGAKWGNYVSVARFGEEKFTNPKYFPINSDGRHLSASVEEHPSAAALYALLNMSFTKARQEGANNRIVLYSIFDVFANHMASMAQYNAMALPILDALKWFNYQQVFINDDGKKTVTASVREQMSRVYGVPEETKPGSGKQGYAETFIVNIIKAFNGTAAQGTPYDTLGLKSMHLYSVAQVAYNLRVVMQQPISITRAGTLISYRSIIKGMKFKPSAIKKNIEEMQKYSGIAAWKSLGFYDVNISRGLTHLIKHDSNLIDKINDVGMWGAEKADTLTWAAIWSASKEEVMKEQHLTPESDGFYEAVTKLFEDVIYKTQVVDSVLTKNEFMRDKGTFARLVGAFMSEPTTNASMLVNALDKYNLDVKRGMTKRQAWQKNGQMIGRTMYVYAVGAVLLAAVQAAADALRDDDEYEELDEKWLDAFIGNFVDELMPFNKLPIISDFYDLAKSLLSVFGVDTYGNPPQSVFMQWYDSLVKGTDIIYDKITGETTNYTWYGGISKLLQALSGMTGLPMGSATREIITAWNNIVGYMAPSLKVVTYEATQTERRNALYKAITSGDTQEAERIMAEYDEQKDVNAALRKALRENDPRIREAAEAVMNGKGADYARILNEIAGEGKFSREIIAGAIGAEVDKLKREASENK